ncbi:hypothetical protein OSB04_015497 [Centaurea solstitialis]|uniref:Uncharacterized protein n=1 Tax=Centaurea solstitialis TaxID=347529 RepID=A0AA38W7J6_9ASTR|nr:hypothetical protein OSB04_015497 [Centaurea solstitialis]
MNDFHGLQTDLNRSNDFIGSLSMIRNWISKGSRWKPKPNHFSISDSISVSVFCEPNAPLAISIPSFPEEKKHRIQFESSTAMIRSDKYDIFSHFTCKCKQFTLTIDCTEVRFELGPLDYQHNVLEHVGSAIHNYISTFASTVKRNNPSSIWPQNGRSGNHENSSNFLRMADQPAYRKTFIESSIKTARLYGFQGLDLYFTTL